MRTLVRTIIAYINVFLCSYRAYESTLKNRNKSENIRTVFHFQNMYSSTTDGIVDESVECIVYPT